MSILPRALLILAVLANAVVAAPETGDLRKSKAYLREVKKHLLESFIDSDRVREEDLIVAGLKAMAAAMDDAIVDGALEPPPGARVPLALFRAARADYSLHRLFHYTGTDPEHFQNFVIFTNYQFYVDVFARFCREHIGLGQPGLDAFVEPGNEIGRAHV